MSLHSMLPERERLAVQAVLTRMYRDSRSDQMVAEKVGVSQQAVNKARLHAIVGPMVASGLYSHLGLTREAFLLKYATPVDRLILDPQNPDHYAAMVRAIGRSMGMAPDHVDAFLAAARRHGTIPVERVPGALEAFMLTQDAAREEGDSQEIDELEARTTPRLSKRRRTK